MIVEVDERAEKLVLKIGLFEQIQNKLNIKRWATVQELNFIPDLPELDRGSGINEIVEAFEQANIKVEKKRGMESRGEDRRALNNRMGLSQTENSMRQDMDKRKGMNTERNNADVNKEQGENGALLKPNKANQNEERRNSFTRKQGLQHGADTYDRLEEIVNQRKRKGVNKDDDNRRLDPTMRK